MGGHDLKNEAQSEENSARPPAGLGQKIPCLSDSDERVRGRAGTAEVRREAGSLSTLEQDGSNEDDTVQDQQGKKKRVNH